MPSEDTKIEEFNQYQISDKAPFIIYADLECIIEKIDGCKNNPENSFTTKVSKHIPSGFLMSTISSFKSVENKQLQESYKNVKICCICKEKFENKYVTDKKHCKIRNHYHYAGAYRGSAHSICYLEFSVPQKTLIVFHNESNYDYH